MVLQFLRRQTRQPSGIATGGGETGFDTQPQPHLFSVRLSEATPAKSVPLPKGTQIFGTYIAPVFGDEPTDGTVGIANATAETDLIAESTAPAVVAVKASGANTGTGTFVIDPTAPVQPGGKAGVYKLRCITAVTNGGVFRLEGPDGDVLGDFPLTPGASANITITEQIKGLLTESATDFIVGDGWDITVGAVAAILRKDKLLAPLILAADSLFEFTSDDLDGSVDVGLELILPRIRA